MLAAGFDVEEMALDKEEAKQLAEGIGNVAQHYAVEVNPKVLAWAGLAGVIGAIYGPRFAAIRMKKKAKSKKGEAEQEPSNAPANVMAFNPQQFGAQ